MDFSRAPKETLVSQITLISKSFRRRDYSDGACGHFEKHHKISIFFALFTVWLQNKQTKKTHYSWSIMVALYPSYMLLQENWTMSPLWLLVISAISLPPTDIDECAEVNGGCQQGCINTHSSFHCHCWAGYRLHSDGRTCLSEYMLQGMVICFSPMFLYKCKGL